MLRNSFFKSSRSIGACERPFAVHQSSVDMLAIIVATSAAPTPPVVDNKRKLGGTVDDGFMGFATAQHSQEALAQQWRENCPPCPTGGFCCPALGTPSGG